MQYGISNRRYTGSKAKLADWILSLIGEHCEGESFFDIFAGTGIVASTAARSFKRIIVNDFLYSNYAIYQGFFGKGRWSSSKVRDIIGEYNEINPKRIKDNYFSNNFGGKYYSDNVARSIGFIREDIERRKNDISTKEYYVLLASLLYSVDKIANTVGHYDAYFRKKPSIDKFSFNPIEPIKINDIKIYRKDANLLAKSEKADIVYIDPPYNSRQYSRFYHLLETLTKWDKQELYGVALKPIPENTSDYCKVSAAGKLENLIGNLDCRYAVISYNNTFDPKSNSSKNKITYEQIRSILNKKGSIKEFFIDHKHFNCGKTDFDNHKEGVFIVKVHG